MTKNVTYIFGAGASAHAIPVVKSFNARLELFFKFLEKLRGEHLKYAIEFRNDVQYILEESKKHSTIDTLAKKYFHTLQNNQAELKKLKNVLTVFLLYEQMRTDLFYNENKFTDNTNNYNFLKAAYGYDEEDIKQFIKNKKSKIDYRYD